VISLNVTIDNGAPIESAISGLASQIPFAAAKAINLTLQDAQSTIRQHLPSEFTLRRQSFIEQTIYIAPKDFAKKDNLVGTVRVNPARDFLAKFEYGGTKRSIAGKALAVPIIRESQPMLIINRGDPLAVKMLMASIQAGHGKVFSTRRSKGGLKVTIDPNRVFLVKNANGTFIVQRTGPASTDTRVLYAFKRSVPIKADLDFEQIAMAVALARWDFNVGEAIQYAIDTMR
jgi:hypothetical protein